MVRDRGRERESWSKSDGQREKETERERWSEKKGTKKLRDS